MQQMNDSQTRIAETTEGMIVVDAGPGTGKTHTIVERYINMISRPDTKPQDILLLTFTNNAALEMGERIRKRLTSIGREKDANFVRTMTFDSFCMSIVMDSPEQVGKFFGFEEKLTRGASLSESDTMNREYFGRFFDGFINDRGEDYGDWAVLASQYPFDLMALINRLMSKGIIPVKRGWFGDDVDRELSGLREPLIEKLNDLNTAGPSGGRSALMKDLIEKRDRICLDLPEGSALDEQLIIDAVDDDRTGLFAFIHDVYYEFIRRSVADNRLTFGLNAMFAFTLLYDNRVVRERNSFRYLMIDEFQDTNANQLMTSLMILSEPNLCVVGDWKQGIYGFRYVSIENILEFEERVVRLRRFLNDDTVRVSFHMPDEVHKMPLDENYRSSRIILDTAFRCMYLPGSKEEDIDEDAVRSNVVEISASRTDIGDDTEVRYVQIKGDDTETDAIVRCVREYVGSGRYVVNSTDSSRPLGFGDIAVICRKTDHCRKTMEALEAAGIPSYLQGDVKIMSTREGKLALAWLRYVNNESDPWGYVPIMADMNYSMREIRSVKGDQKLMPSELTEQRRRLYNRRRRITELMTSLFSFYNLDNDITQAIITTVSSVHRRSLLTISDIIRMIEEDIALGTDYPVENPIDRDAVTIMTMHKSKGLEFPAVIIPFMDERVMPSTMRDSGEFVFDDEIGIRCGKEIGRFDGYSKICDSWRTRIVRKARSKDYSEERRLMFVSMSRAKQYETLICGKKPSIFMDRLSGGLYTDIADTDLGPLHGASDAVERPDLSGYAQRRIRMGVHDLMDFSLPEDDDTDVVGKGIEYGEEIHRVAQMMFLNRHVDADYPEMEEIRKVLDRVADADLTYSEMDCGLPVDGKNITLHGIIDLIAVYPDRVEIHDYKTDVTRRFENEYMFQLSVYAHAASGYYGRKARCFIDYVSMKECVEFDPMSKDEILRRVELITHPTD